MGARLALGREVRCQTFIREFTLTSCRKYEAECRAMPRDKYTSMSRQGFPTSSYPQFCTYIFRFPSPSKTDSLLNLRAPFFAPTASMAWDTKLSDPLPTDIIEVTGAFLDSCFPDSWHTCYCVIPYKGTSLHFLDLLEDGPVEARPLLSALQDIVSLQQRFLQLKEAATLLKQMGLCQDMLSTLADDDEARPCVLYYLAIAYHQQFMETKERRDIDAAVDTYRRCLRFTRGDDPLRAWVLAQLGAALHLRYIHGLSANVRDMFESVRSLRLARYLSKSNQPFLDYITHRLLHSLVSLGYLWIGAFHRLPSKSMSMLEEAILCLEEASELYPSVDSVCVYTFLHLGNAHRAVWEHTADRTALEMYVLYCRQAADLTPDGNEERWYAMLHLGIACKGLSEYPNGAAFLDEAIECFRQSVELCPPNNDFYCDPLTSLGCALLLRYRKIGDLTLLDEVVAVEEEALRHAPKCHAARHQVLHCLSESLVERYKRTAQDDDALRVIQYCEELLGMLSGGHEVRYLAYKFLAEIHFRRSSGAEPDGLAVAMNYLLLMMKDDFGSVNRRLPEAATLLREVRGRLKSAPLDQQNCLRTDLLQIYQYALRLLPRKAFLGLDVTARLKVLSEYDTLATDAAVLALSCGRPDVATECLAEGRAVFWSQASQLRTSLDGLPKEMADELRSLSHALEQGSYRLLEDESTPDQRSLREMNSSMRRHNARFEEVVESVRSLPYFGQFLSSPPFLVLAQVARGGPVVSLISDDDHCHAVIIRSDQPPLHVPLRGLTSRHVLEMANMIKDECKTHRLGLEGRMRQGRAMSQIKPPGASRWSKHLSMLWRAVVWPVLDALQLGVSPNSKYPLCNYSTITIGMFRPRSPSDNMVAHRIFHICAGACC
jgi:tetratricopeptide (TPR) repeat protein